MNRKCPSRFPPILEHSNLLMLTASSVAKKVSSCMPLCFADAYAGVILMSSLFSLEVSGLSMNSHLAESLRDYCHA